MPTVTLKPDFGPLLKLLDALKTATQEGRCSAKQLREFLLNLRETPLEFVSLDVVSGPALGADECRVRLQPTDRLLDLMTALTGHSDFLVIKKPIHKPSRGES